MKTLRISLTTTLTIGLALAASAFAQQPAPAASSRQKSNGTETKLQIATDHAKDQADGKYTGRAVKGSDGKGLGNIKDFMINPAAGRAEYAVITTGGLAGIGDKLRLVPLQSLRPAGGKDFSLSIAKDQWDKIAPLPQDAYKADKMTVTDSERRQIAAHFTATKSADSAATYTTDLTSSLIKASDLHGKEVRSTGKDIGKLDGVVIDIVHGTAQALFDPKHDFAGTNQKFLVPLNQFTIGGSHEPASASLTREEFDRVSGRGQVSSSSTGTLPVASTAQASSQVARAPANSKSTEQKAAASQSEPSPSMTGRDTTQTASADKNAQPATTNGNEQSQNVAAADKTTSSKSQSSQTSIVANTTNDIARDKSSTAPSAGGTTTSDTSLSHTDRADTNGVNPAAVVANSATVDPFAAAKADGQSPTSSPPNRSSEGQDIASTVPASPSSKAPAESQQNSSAVAANSTSSSSQKSEATMKVADSQASAGLAANSTPPRSSTSADSTPRSASPNTADRELTPTGQTSADQSPSTDPALNGAALAVRKALDNNPSLARLNVAVTPENGKLVLRGLVATSQLKTAIEEAAERAANGKQIDSQVTIGNP